MAAFKILLLVLLPVGETGQDIYAAYPPESWLEINFSKYGFSHFDFQKNALKGQNADFFKKNYIVLKHLLANVVYARLDRSLKDRDVVMMGFKENYRFKNLFEILISQEKSMTPVQEEQICRAMLKYLRPNFHKLQVGDKKAFHKCIFPSASQIPGNEEVIVDALAYSALDQMRKNVYRELKRDWEAYVANLFETQNPQGMDDYWRLLSKAQQDFPISEAFRNSVRQEYRRLKTWMPFELTGTDS